MKKVRDGRIRNTTNADARQHKRQKVGAAPPNSRRRLVSVRLLCSCLAWCFRRVGFKALFSDAQSLLVQVGLLGHVPYLRDYHRPEHQQRDRRGDGLLAEDTHPSIYRGPICYRLYLYVQGRLHAYYGLEGASLADAHLRPPCGDVRFGHLEVLILEVAHHILGDGGDVLDYVGKGLGRVKGSHPKRLLSLWAYVPCVYFLPVSPWRATFYGSAEEACSRSACRAFSTAISPKASVAKALASGESASSSCLRSVTTLKVCSRSSVSVIFPSSTILL